MISPVWRQVLAEMEKREENRGQTKNNWTGVYYGADRRTPHALDPWSCPTVRYASFVQFNFPPHVKDNNLWPISSPPPTFLPASAGWLHVALSIACAGHRSNRASRSGSCGDRAGWWSWPTMRTIPACCRWAVCNEKRGCSDIAASVRVCSWVECICEREERTSQKPKNQRNQLHGPSHRLHRPSGGKWKNEALQTFGCVMDWFRFAFRFRWSLFHSGRVWNCVKTVTVSLINYKLSLLRARTCLKVAEIRMIYFTILGLTVQSKRRLTIYKML